MYTRTKSVLVSLSLLAALPAFAHEEGASSSLKSGNSVPVPTKIVQPVVSARQVGKAVLLQFTVTKEGKPTNIQTVDFQPEDAVLAERISRALRSWEFAPALGSDGQAVAMKVTMPIKVDGFGQPDLQLDPRQGQLVATK